MIVDDISEMVAKKLGLSLMQVREINRIQWKMLHKEMQSGEFNSVQIFYIGKFSRKLTKEENIAAYTNESSKRDI
jgi:hypothetical protein